MIYYTSLFLISIGTVFILIASFGILRMPDLLMRMHAATKAGSLGVGFVLLGVSIDFQKFNVTLESIIAIVFIAITAPIASHLIARAAYFQGIQLTKATFIDELKLHYNQETHQLESVSILEVNKK